MSAMSVDPAPPGVSASPELSIVVVFYQMAREGPRTLISLTPPYQRGLGDLDYEIIGIEHGSARPLVVPDVPALRHRLRMIRYATAPVSPVEAINAAVRSYCRGRYVMICIDGARIASAELVARSIAACRALVNPPLVVSLAWHLGSEVQAHSVPRGYDRAVEDGLLARIGWPADADRLFEIAVFAGSSERGYFSPIAESNAFLLEREAFLAIGGYRESFAGPGGGLANLEVFERLVAAHEGRVVTLIGDGTFHQHHGGAATANADYFGQALPEYQAILGRDYRIPAYTSLYSARFPAAAHGFLEQSLAVIRPALGAAPAPG